ncbi:MAG: hypothetical protein M1305_01075 [Candidatus Marsarchaeota archaeon]|nr:hypothetical protein [Candidatus Marsarchaeota archaeon]
MTSDAKNILNQVSRMQFQIANIKGLEKRLRALEAGGGGGDTGDHALLTHLDYAHAGHTGFQAALGFTAVPNTRIVAGHPLSGDVTLSKGDVGLGNVDNTSDAEKPIGTATQTALDGKQAALGFTPENGANKDTDGTLAANSDIKYPSQRAVRTYVDAHSGTGMADYRTLNDGRLVRTSDTMLSWNGYAIGLWNGSTWAEVIPSSIPTLSNTATDLDGNALTYGANYDVYAQYSDATAFSLVAKKWTNDTTQAVVPQLWQGRHCYDNTTDVAKSRRWLGTIRLINSAGPKFVFSDTQRFICNLYNQESLLLRMYNTTGAYSTNTTNLRETNNGTGAVRGEVVLCFAQDVRFSGQWLITPGTGAAVMGLGINSTTTGTNNWPLWVPGSNGQRRAPYFGFAILAAGYSYCTVLERVDSGTTTYESSSGTQGLVTFQVLA